MLNSLIAKHNGFTYDSTTEVFLKDGVIVQGRLLSDEKKVGVQIDYFAPINQYILDGNQKLTPTLESLLEPPKKLFENIQDFYSMLNATEPKLSNSTSASDIGTIAIVSHL